MTTTDKPAASENCLAVGTRLADFEITGILGEGGFGIVYMAFDHSLQRSVAIKEYMPGPLASRGGDNSVTVRAGRHQDTFDLGLKSFINEARFLAQFDHPSLVKVYRFWEQNQTAYTAMQYYEGRTIKDIVANSPELVTEAWCMGVLRQILGALETLYTMQLLHRDVSPDNIIVQDNGDAVLLDFGSARQIIGDMTRGLTVILKPGYAPIEQYAGDASLPQGPFTDIYALASVMYFAIIKEPPPTSIARMIKDPMTPLAERQLDGFGAGFLCALDNALAVAAEDRPQTIDAFRALLGIHAPGMARARPPGATVRIATVDHVPRLAPLAAAAAKPAGQRAARFARWKIAALVAGLALPAALIYTLSSSDDVMIVAQSVARPAAVAAAVPEPAPLQAPDLESQAWDTLKASPGATAAAIDDFLRAYPDGRYAMPARQWLAELAEPPAPAVAAVVAKPAPPKIATASYQLRVKPWATVHVDGKERGVSPPLKKLTLTAGVHMVKLANPGFPDHVTRIVVKPGQSGMIAHDFTATPK